MGFGRLGLAVFFAFLGFDPPGEDEEVESGDPEDEEKDSAGEEESEFGPIVEPGAIVKAFDEVGTAVGDLEDFGFGEVDLDFPVALADDFGEVAFGLDIDAFDIFPLGDSGIGL